MPFATPSCGALLGEQGRGVIRFRGIPYATAQRFGQPIPAPPWAGTRDATRHGPIPPQPQSRLRAAMGDIDRPQDEDCLTLTLATPAIDGARRPVLVFLHGGAYWTGAGSLDWYDGGTLAAENGCVVVGVNYRLGALGFLAHPDVSPGNLGIADMVTALRWVATHIASFGGDPDNVTVIGQSAGAHAIMVLLTETASDGLFHRAVLMSTPPSLATKTTQAAAQDAVFLADKLGTTPGGLAQVPVPGLIDAGLQRARTNARFADATPPFIPVSDAFADPDSFIAAAARAAASRGIALIIGTTREEMHAFFAPDPAMATPDPALVAATFARLAGDAAAIEAYRARRPGATTRDLLGDLVTDDMFLRPSIGLADAVTASGGRVHLYQFDWAAPANPFMACHCIDLPFLFGNFEAWTDARMLAGADPAQLATLSAAFRAALAAFARDGDPTSPGLRWPPYRAPSRITMAYGAVIRQLGDLAGAGWRLAPHTRTEHSA